MAGANKKKTANSIQTFGQVSMKLSRLQRLLLALRRDDAGATTLATGALLVATILYASTMVS